MPSTIPRNTNCQLHKGLVGCAIRICLDDCTLANSYIATDRSLVPNLDRTWQNETSHIAHSVFPLYRKPNPNKFGMYLGGFSHSKIDMAFCLRGGYAHTLNELREGPATAYQK